MTTQYPTCHICAEPTSEHCRAECYACGLPFHLALRQDIPGKDCGDVWLDEDHLALEFACNRCLAAESATAAPASSAPATAAPEGKRRYARREGMRANLVARSRRSRT